MTRRTPEQAERLRQIVQMRRAHLGQDQIADRLGISQQRVSQLYKQALAEVPAQDIDQHRAEELILIDDAIRGLLRIASDPSVPRGRRSRRGARSAGGRIARPGSSAWTRHPGPAWRSSPRT